MAGIEKPFPKENRRGCIPFIFTFFFVRLIQPKHQLFRAEITMWDDVLSENSFPILKLKIQTR